MKGKIIAAVALGIAVAICWDDLIIGPACALRIKEELKNANTSTKVVPEDHHPQAAANDSSTSSRRLPSPIYPIPKDQLRHTIRKWGCNRTETPFIFVHVGKAGGGSVRARIAASSQNYSLNHDWTKNFGAYYPAIMPSSDNTNNNNSQTEEEAIKARFCNSCFSNRRPSALDPSYEGTLGCHASTPIGQAIACPEGIQLTPQEQALRQNSGNVRARAQCMHNSTTCHMIYVGHNWLGAEFHWLPYKFLMNWWQSLQLPQTHASQNIPWYRLDPNNIWCDHHNISRPLTNHQYHQKPTIYYETCSIPLAHQVDAIASVALYTPKHDGIIDSWASVYASLPVLRVTVLREPFSWLMSKFFWHRYHEPRPQQPAWVKATAGSNSNSNNNMLPPLICDNLQQALGRSPTTTTRQQDDATRADYFPRRQEFYENGGKPGWLVLFCFDYLLYICGEDCAVRYASGKANWDMLEGQAEENLRHSFTVVGILEDEGLDEFYKMINARIQYMDTTLNWDEQLEATFSVKHSTINHGEALRCKQAYQQSTFQQQLLSASHELRVIHRLYQVAKEVNKFQRQELEECSPDSFQ